MGSFEKKRCLDNIYFLAKEKNIRIGDLEARAGVSAGYFSRLNKEDSKANPSIEVLTAVSEKLGVTIDALINYSYNELNSSEKYILNFIERLLSLTVSGDKLWDRERIKKVLSLGVDEDNVAIHPLMEVRTVFTQIDQTTGYPDYHEGVVYNSLFHEDEYIGLLGDIYSIEIDQSRTVYLTLIGAGEDEDAGIPPQEEYEMYIVSGREVSPVCHSSYNQNTPFNTALENLYKAASESSKHPKINSMVKSAIDDFMAFNDPDLPF